MAGYFTLPADESDLGYYSWDKIGLSIDTQVERFSQEENSEYRYNILLSGRMKTRWGVQENQ